MTSKSGSVNENCCYFIQSLLMQVCLVLELKFVGMVLCVNPCCSLHRMGTPLQVERACDCDDGVTKLLN